MELSIFFDLWIFVPMKRFYSRGKVYRNNLNVSFPPEFLINVPKHLNFKKLDKNLKFQVLEMPKKDEIPKLEHSLEKVLLSPGVHHLKQNGVNVFGKFLERIIQPSEITFKSEFVKPNQDEKLKVICEKYKTKYQSSTSSMSSLLTLLYLQISGQKRNYANLLSSFKDSSTKFTNSVLKPTTVILSPFGDSYSVDKYEESSFSHILSDLGNTLEKMLTSKPQNLLKPQKASYQYTQFGNFVIRAQLDCYSDLRKVFDIKSRATSAVRYDVQNYKDHSKNSIDHLVGKFNSYEKEFYDMIRSVFIKYSLQGRMGCMNGMFIVYHNTLNIHGFEYIECAEIEKYVFGNPYIAEKSFIWEMNLLETIFDEIINRFPNQNLKVTFDTETNSKTRIWVEPLLSDRVYVYELHTYIHKNGKLLKSYHFNELDHIEFYYSYNLVSELDVNSFEYKNVLNRSNNNNKVLSPEFVTK